MPGRTQVGAVVALLYIVAAGFARAERVEREIILYGHPFPRSIVLLVDASGSMEGEPYHLAVHEAMSIAEQAADDGLVRFYAFSANIVADPQGWIKLPDAEALSIAGAFLAHSAPCSGWSNTNLVGAMEHVLALKESPIGVVILTDGRPDGEDEDINAIRALNAARETPAVIGVVGVLTDSEVGDSFCRIVSKTEGGAYLRVKRKKD